MRGCLDTLLEVVLFMSLLARITQLSFIRRFGADPSKAILRGWMRWLPGESSVVDDRLYMTVVDLQKMLLSAPPIRVRKSPEHFHLR